MIAQKAISEWLGHPIDKAQIHQSTLKLWVNSTEYAALVMVLCNRIHQLRDMGLQWIEVTGSDGLSTALNVEVVCTLKDQFF
ncbi:hypothetical protein ACQ4M4_09395 [Leptolyngbya sp. AN02str]|uniref:hypothetical protein n=1 Tax=Leptolyngbya sp. AN02str TaxID=3423363 RepID=UPI003D316265